MDIGIFIFACIITSFYCALPIFIIFEITYLITNPKEINYPYVLGLPLSLLISIALIFGFFSGTTGEAGFGAILISPGILISSLFFGYFISRYYKVRNKPILPRTLKAWLYATLVLLMALSSIFIHFEPPHSGITLDSESEKPVPQVLVRQTLDYECMLPLYPVGENSRFMGYAETFSNSEGKYSLPFQIHFKYPYFCWGENDTLEFVKAGYFVNNHSDSEKATTLYKANHLFSFKENTREIHFSPKDYSDEIEKRSKLTEKAVKATKNLYPLPDGEVGVFLSAPGKQFTKLYRSFDNEVYGRELFYAYDEKSKTWFAFDKRGIPLKDKHTSNILESKINKQNYDDVSDFFDSGYNEVFTIEGNNKVVCKYSRKELDFCFKASDLPQIGNDDTLGTAQFIGFLRNDTGGRQAVVAKTDKFTHFYDVDYRRAGTNHIWKIKEREYLLSDRNITAVAADNLLLGLSDGIILSRYSQSTDKIMKHKDFSPNMFDLNIKSIKSILWSSNRLFLYVTDGTDKIYRFDKSGIYDFKVNIIEEPLSDITVIKPDSRHLFGAIRNADHKLLEKLLKSGADPDIKDRNGFTPLYFARKLSFPSRFSRSERRQIYLDMIGLLLKHGADPSIKDQNGELMLGFNHIQDSPEFVKTLIKNSTHPGALYIDGENQLTSCVASGRTTDTTPCVQFLLSAGIDQNHKNTDGKYPLWIAVEQMDLRMVRLLLENGADPKIINEHGQNLFWAILSTLPHPNDRRRQEEILELLCANDVQLNAKDKNGDTALTLARKHGNIAAIKLLENAGAVE